MPSFRNRSYQPELLDRPDIPFDDIRRNMDELDFINTWLGGHAITVAGLKKMLRGVAGDHLVICEIGCGGGNNLRAVDRWLQKKKIRASYIGIDINPHCIEHAKATARLGNAEWITADYKAVQFDVKPHIIFTSLFCHHFTDDELTFMVRWMRDNTRMGFFINDLHRHPLAFHSIRLLTRLFSRSYLVKNDAPLSVLRGFSRKELSTLMQRPGLLNCSIEWRWAFRWLVVAKKAS
ncbi:MAG TPA: methyltransferase domain-containing protein [Chitinophagaceae bacterium]|nr:methyltransferase domain-containing protein [Chitinophagaceae bacterium]